MRPALQFLDADLRSRIIAEARTVLCTLGVEVHNPLVLSLLGDHGATVRAADQRAIFTEALIDKALKTAPSGFKLYDATGRVAHDLSGTNVHFTPGTAAISVLDHGAMASRPPTTADVVALTKVMAQLANIAF